ncbi:hypothetical protein L1987_08332 [Smallanthus sonchifolius]|uniref:Uncharacterized protein n=1 Tax=Smallanthus sonchifolius TaxID=185202 RepID=A0ACB9JKE2_9ASTR|nr:hypothetical protein L1987_08332 [Smallanthus sonchifolius]
MILRWWLLRFGRQLGKGGREMGKRGGGSFNCSDSSIIDKFSLKQSSRYLSPENYEQPESAKKGIDQIILCSFYGVAKISQLNLTFKEIIYYYRKQPKYKPQVFRVVFVDDRSTARTNGKTDIDIIMFYNEIFIPAVRPLLVELARAGVAKTTNQVSETNNNDEGQCPGSPKVSLFRSLPSMSPKTVSAVYNVSPLRSTKMKQLFKMFDHGDGAGSLYYEAGYVLTTEKLTGMAKSLACRHARGYNTS